ncbi:mitochondrial calcium uniporter regulator 1 isoform X2 [Syngnathus scovelli]|uniref:mitochondrial calcium uniporter regulator 1 isoform X2 n=1 Tax=Syngnathus scovelli TaxID=161590 RepID=UPI002110D2C1|nr:mitochondrial calcium uniporter regulator 1 isoform X2 [Syngnathus scovelli]
MVLKQCHTRLRVFVLCHNKKRFSLASTDSVRFSRRLSWNVLPIDLRWSHFKSSASFSSDTVRRRYLHLSAREKNYFSPIQSDVQTDAPKVRKLFFDTHAVVRLLEENGFTTQEAEALIKALLNMTNSTMDTIYSDMVTKVQQEIMMQRIMSQIAALKKDMVILEKSEFTTLLTENEKLKIQLWQLKAQLADVMNKVRSDTLLDMNLEKTRVKELKVHHEKKLMETRTEILEMVQCSLVSPWS